MKMNKESEMTVEKEGFHPDERDCSVSTQSLSQPKQNGTEIVSIPTSGIVLFLLEDMVEYVRRGEAPFPSRRAGLFCFY